MAILIRAIVVTTSLALLAGVGSASAQYPVWSTQVIWQVGSADSANYDLSSISGVAVDALGRVYVGQAQERSVRVYDSAGRYVRSIGRPGRGPGELESVHEIFVRGDELHVVDFAQQRMNVYDTVGTHRRTVTQANLGVSGGTAAYGPHALFPDAAVLLSIRREGDGASAVELLSGRSGRPLRPIARMTWEPPMVRVQSGRMVTVLPALVHGGSLWVADPAAATVTILHRSTPARTTGVDTFRVARIMADGSSVFSRAFQYQVRELPAQEVDRLVVVRMQRFSQMMMEMREAAPEMPLSDLEEMTAAYRKAISGRTLKPAVDAFLVGTDGSVWLRKYPVTSGPATWMVLDRQGVLVAHVTAPLDWTLLTATADFIYASAKDQFDLPRLIKARIVK